MSVASGSIAFLGAARFQGFWNADTNEATGSGLSDVATYLFGGAGVVNELFATGTSAGGGYAKRGAVGASGHNLTASIGDYWQVTGSGVHNIDGQTSWNLNDWVIYSGSTGSPPSTWRKLAFEDTIASIIIGDLSSSSFHIGDGNDKHVIFATGSVHSGSNNFTYDYTNNRVGIGTSSPASLLHVTDTETASGDDIVRFLRPALANGNYYSIGFGRALSAGESAFLEYHYSSTTANSFVGIGNYGDAVDGGVGLVVRKGGNVGLGTTSPVATAILELSSSAKGFLPPRLATTERDAISSPAEGLVVYNDTTNQLNVYNGSAWTIAGGATINDATENELVTVASTVTELDAEANLTFDGSTLKVLGAVAANVVSNIAAIAVGTTITAGYNSLMLGPITLNDGITLTVQDGAVLKIKDISDI